MAAADQARRRKLQDDERRAREIYDAVVAMRPLPSEGISELQLDRLVNRSKRDLDIAVAAVAAFEAEHRAIS